MLNRYRWLLFDLDNTLLDFNASSAEAFFSLCHHIGLTVENDELSLYRKVNKVVWGELEDGKITADELKWKRFKLFFEEVGINHDPQEANEYFLNALVEHTHFVDGAINVLEKVKGDFNCGLITNGLKKVQRPRLKKSNLEHYFEVIVVSEEIGYAKPQPEYFNHAFEQMAHPEKSEVLVIGDNLQSDIKGALQYGVDACWFNQNGHEKSDDINNTFEIKKLDQLLNILG